MDIDYTALEQGQRKKITFETTLTSFYQRMLQEAYNFAGALPDRVHVYLQIQDGRAGAGFLFESAGKVFELDTISELTSTIDYIPDEGHVQQLMNRTGEILLEYINHFISHARPIPSEAWTTADIATNGINTFNGYNFGRPVVETQEALQAWKKDLEDPSYAVFRNLALLELPPF